MALGTRYFQTARELTTFVNDPTNNVITVISVTFDAASGKFVLFYE